ncbi:hypothetical protein HMPREF3039_00974 [Akkermansia sp. KLE1798]|nr:hypothetical protein HMPREF3039_00974 [Akkermansia sp. KLE1798]
MKEEKSNSLRISGTAEQLPAHFCPRRRKDFFSPQGRETGYSWTVPSVRLRARRTGETNRTPFTGTEAAILRNSYEY